MYEISGACDKLTAQTGTFLFQLVGVRRKLDSRGEESVKLDGLQGRSLFKRPAITSCFFKRPLMISHTTSQSLVSGMIVDVNHLHTTSGVEPKKGVCKLVINEACGRVNIEVVDSHCIVESGRVVSTQSECAWVSIRICIDCCSRSRLSNRRRSRNLNMTSAFLLIAATVLLWRSTERH